MELPIQEIQTRAIKMQSQQKQPTHPNMHIAEIRALAKRFDAAAIDQCMTLALENKPNPCYAAGELEEVMNVLAKTSFVTAQIAQGQSMAEAIRELGKRVRSLIDEEGA